MPSTSKKIDQILVCAPYLKGFNPSTIEGIKDYYEDRGQYTASQETAVDNVYTLWNIEHILNENELPCRRPRSCAVTDIRGFFVDSEPHQDTMQKPAQKPFSRTNKRLIIREFCVEKKARCSVCDNTRRAYWSDDIWGPCIECCCMSCGSVYPCKTKDCK
jgi:hypothetical protein